MKSKSTGALALGFLLGWPPVWADQKWVQKDFHSWTTSQAEQVLNDSAWSKAAGATIYVPKKDPLSQDIPLPQPSNAPAKNPTFASDGYGVDDGRWDGGVGKIRRGEPPKIPVAIRWDSALPVRQALLKTRGAALLDTEATLGQAETYYTVSLYGIVSTPAKAKPGDDDFDLPPQEPVALDLNAMRAGFISATRILLPDRQALVPQDVHVDPATGRIQIFFPKSQPITLQDKEIVFHTRYGGLEVYQRFRLKDMVVNGKLEL